MLEHFVLAIVYASRHIDKETLEVYITVTWCRVFAWAVQHASFRRYYSCPFLRTKTMVCFSQRYGRIVFPVSCHYNLFLKWMRRTEYIEYIHFRLALIFVIRTQDNPRSNSINACNPLSWNEDLGCKCIWNRSKNTTQSGFLYVCLLYVRVYDTPMSLLFTVLCMALAHSKYSTCTISCLHSIDEFFNVKLKECPLPVSRLKFCQMFCGECIFRYRLTQDVQKITSPSSVSHIILCEPNWLSLHNHVCMKYQLSSLNMTDNFPCKNSQMSSTPYKRF